MKVKNPRTCHCPLDEGPGIRMHGELVSKGPVVGPKWCGECGGLVAGTPRIMDEVFRYCYGCWPHQNETESGKRIHSGSWWTPGLLALLAIVFFTVLMLML